MRRILLVLTVALVLAAVMVASAVPAFAQGEGASVTQCSEVFGPEHSGVIVFAPDGTPALFTCQGGIFEQGQGGGAIVTQCSEFFGDPEMTGVIVITPGGTPSNFTCQGGIFG
jgi:hypothetical protein